MRSAWFLLMEILVMTGVVADEVAENLFDRTRHKAALVALFNYNPTPQLKKDFLCQRACLTALGRMFTLEGGYYAARVPAILEIRDPETEAVARLFRELDGKLTANATPRTLQMASVVAMAYTEPSQSGVYAAMHAARQVEGDPDNDAIARAAYSLLTHIIGGREKDRGELLKIAALNADDEKVSREIRALPLREWRNLPDERRGVGRLCRALFIWSRAKNWQEAERMSRQLLNYHESRRFLGIIAAAWFDLPNLPEDLLLEAAADRDSHELCGALYELANRQILITVPRDLVLKDLSAGDAETVSVEETGDAPTLETDNLNAARENLPEPLAPRLPENPRMASTPRMPETPKSPRRPAGFFATKANPAPAFAENLRVMPPAGDYLTVAFPAGK